MKRRFSLLAAVIVCLSLLSACGKPAAGGSSLPPSLAPSQEPSSAPSQAPSAEPSQEPSEAPSQAPSAEPSGQPSQAPDQVQPGLTLSMGDATITYPGYVLKLSPTFTGLGSHTPALTWSSSDEAVAGVDQNGAVTSLTPGKAVITAETADGLKATCIVRCRWSEETAEPSPSQTPSGSGLTAFAEDIIERYQLPAFLSLADEELTEGFYPGLAALGTVERLVYVNQMSLNMGELVLIQLSDAKDVGAAEAILQARIDGMINGGAWYPDPTEMWTSNSRVVSSGNYVMMVVSESCDAIADEFKALF